MKTNFEYNVLIDLDNLKYNAVFTIAHVKDGAIVHTVVCKKNIGIFDTYLEVGIFGQNCQKSKLIYLCDIVEYLY